MLNYQKSKKKNQKPKKEILMTNSKLLKPNKIGCPN